jgi:hypothetical protein
MNHITLQLPDALSAHLSKIAQREAISETDLILDALKKYLEKPAYYFDITPHIVSANLLTKEI